MSGEDIDADALFDAYDEDGDGELSEEETQALMEDNRPEGPSPAEKNAGKSTSSAWAQASGVES